MKYNQLSNPLFHTKTIYMNKLSNKNFLYKSDKWCSCKSHNHIKNAMLLFTNTTTNVL